LELLYELSPVAQFLFLVVALSSVFGFGLYKFLSHRYAKKLKEKDAHISRLEEEILMFKIRSESKKLIGRSSHRAKR
jgi:hypothetical protein